MNKQNKGITLVALVITIIVLIILAAVSINAVMNDGLIENAKTAKEKYSEAETEEIISLAYYTALVKGQGTVTGTTLQEELEESQITATVTESEDGFTVKVGDVIYIVTDSGEVSVSSPSVAQWSLPTGDTEVNVGDLLTPTVTGLENEKFYVIADDGTTLTLLAERCINTTTNAQVDSGYSITAFDDNSSVYNGSDIQVLVNAYVGNLTGLGLELEDVEVAYNTEPVTNVKGRLMWYEEADEITSPFKDSENYVDILYGTPTNSLSYWLGTSSSVDPHLVYWVAGAYDYYIADEDPSVTCVGLRPVIVISKASVE